MEEPQRPHTHTHTHTHTNKSPHNTLQGSMWSKHNSNELTLSHTHTDAHTPQTDWVKKDDIMNHTTPYPVSSCKQQLCVGRWGGCSLHHSHVVHACFPLFELQLQLFNVPLWNTPEQVTSECHVTNDEQWSLFWTQLRRKEEEDEEEEGEKEGKEVSEVWEEIINSLRTLHTHTHTHTHTHKHLTLQCVCVCV